MSFVGLLVHLLSIIVTSFLSRGLQVLPRKDPPSGPPTKNSSKKLSMFQGNPQNLCLGVVTL